MDTPSMPRGRGRNIFRSGAIQYLQAIERHKVQANTTIQDFEVAAANHRVIISLSALGMKPGEISSALKTHPDSAHWRTTRQVTHVVECARRELETFIMDADRNGAGIKDRILEINAKRSA